ncbi:hypothetical protein HZB88_01700 [archaeon]|nr:hypothetical protein [archaeon]
MKKLLAEIAGVFAGDGSLYRTSRGCVLEIRGSPKELEYYKRYVKPIFERVTNEKVKIIKRNYTGGFLIGIRTCRSNICNFFNKELDFPIGKKSNIVKVPRVIINDKNLWKDYIRGVFDSDGSIYMRTSGRKGKYPQPIVDFSSTSERHLEELYKMLKFIGFNCWKEKNKIRMGGWSTVKRFFDVIKPHNNVMLQRFKGIYKARATGINIIKNTSISHAEVA